MVFLWKHFEVISRRKGTLWMEISNFQFKFAVFSFVCYIFTILLYFFTIFFWVFFWYSFWVYLHKQSDLIYLNLKEFKNPSCSPVKRKMGSRWDAQSRPINFYILNLIINNMLLIIFKVLYYNNMKNIKNLKLLNNYFRRKYTTIIL